MAPGRLGLKVLGRGTASLFSVLKRVTGIDLLEDLSEFFRASATWPTASASAPGA